jgi:hypothetical protein
VVAVVLILALGLQMVVQVELLLLLAQHLPQVVAVAEVVALAAQ